MRCEEKASPRKKGDEEKEREERSETLGMGGIGKELSKESTALH